MATPPPPLLLLLLLSVRVALPLPAPSVTLAVSQQQPEGSPGAPCGGGALLGLATFALSEGGGEGEGGAGCAAQPPDSPLAASGLFFRARAAAGGLQLLAFSDARCAVPAPSGGAGGALLFPAAGGCAQLAEGVELTWAPGGGAWAAAGGSGAEAGELTDEPRAPLPADEEGGPRADRRLQGASDSDTASVSGTGSFTSSYSYSSTGTDSNTPTPTGTSTSSRSAVSSDTASATGSSTGSPSSTASSSGSSTALSSDTGSPTATGTGSASASATGSSTGSHSSTASSSGSRSLLLTESSTPSSTGTGSGSASASATGSSTASPSSTASSSSSHTAMESGTATPTSSGTSSGSASASATGTSSASPSSTASSSGSHTAMESGTGTPTSSGTSSGSASASATGTSSASPSSTASSSGTTSSTGTNSGTGSASSTASSSSSATVSVTPHSSGSPSGSPSESASSTVSPTGSLSVSATLSGSYTTSLTQSRSASVTVSFSGSATGSVSQSPSPFSTPSSSGSPSGSLSTSSTPSATPTDCATVSGTYSTSVTSSPSGSPSTSSTVSSTGSECTTASQCPTVSYTTSVTRTRSQSSSVSVSPSSCGSGSQSVTVTGSRSASGSSSTSASPTHSGSPTASVSGTHTAKWGGYVPPVALLDATTGENVTYSVLDPMRPYLIVVYAGVGFEFIKSVVDRPPTAAELFQSMPTLWRPTIMDAVEVTENYIVYPMPVTAGSVPGECSVTLAAGMLRRSDTTYSRPRQFGISFGWTPVFSFTDGVSTDLEGGGVGAPAWFGSEVNGTLTMIISAPPAVRMADRNATDWVRWGSFYAGDGLPAPEQLPGGLRVLNYTYSNLTLGNSLAITLNVSGVPPGQFPITVGAGAMMDLAPSPYSALGAATGYRNIAVTGWLKIGFTPAWRVFDSATGEDLTGTPVEADADVQLAFVMEGGGATAALAALMVSAGEGLPAAAPAWGALVNSDTATAVALSGALPTVLEGPTSVALAYALAELPAPLPPGNYTLSSLPASGAVCNGLAGRAQLCSARERVPGNLIIGFRPAALVQDGTHTNSYGGALNAQGAPADPAAPPQPCFAASIAVVFSDPTDGSGGGIATAITAAGGGVPASLSWAAAVAAPAGLPPPSSAAAVSGTLVYTWADATLIPSGAYDIVLRPAALQQGVTNVRTVVRLLVGPQFQFLPPDATILPSGADAAGSAPLLQRGGPGGLFVTGARDVVLRLVGAVESTYSLGEALVALTDARTGAPLALSAVAPLASSPWASSAPVGGLPLRTDYAVSLGSLPDGLYTFTLRTGAAAVAGAIAGGMQVTRDITFTDVYGEPLGARGSNGTLLVARAPWVGASVTVATPVGIGGLSGEIPLPPGLFTGSPLLRLGAARVELLATPSNYARGLALANAGGVLREGGAVALHGAVLMSDPGTVAGPPGARTLLLRATNEVGAEAVARLTLNFAARPHAVLHAIDSRDVSNSSVLQVKPSTAEGGSYTLSMGLQAFFDAGVSGAALSDVTCFLEVGAQVRQACATLNVTALAVESTAAGGGVMRYRWSFSLGHEDVGHLVDVPGNYVVLGLSPSTAIVNNATGVPMQPVGEVRVLVDAHAPMYSTQLVLDDDPENPRGRESFPGKFIPLYFPVVGVSYHYTLPYYLLSDQFSCAVCGGVRVVGSVPAWDTQFGLRVQGGALGRAYLYGTAPAVLPAPQQSVFFTLLVEDGAGNQVAYPKNVQVPIMPVPARGVPAIKLSTNQPLAFREGGAPLYFDSALTFTLPPGLPWSEPVDAVRLVLQGGESNSSFLGGQLEELVPYNPCPSRCEVFTYAMDSMTGSGFIEMRPLVSDVDGLYGRDTLANGPMTLLDAKEFLRTATYANSRVRVSSSEVRTLRALVLKKYFDFMEPSGTEFAPEVEFFSWGLVATAARTLTVKAVNNPPVVALLAGAADALWQQPSDPEQSPAAPLFAAALGAAWVSDVDDGVLTAATVQVALAGGGANVGGCDAARDILTLPPNYIPLVRLYASWSAASCTLLLTPAPPLLSVSFSDMREALEAVAYSSLQPANPTGWGVGNSTRRLLLSVIDAGAGGMAPAAGSSPVALLLQLRAAPVQFTLDPEAMLRGSLSSPNPFANTKAYPTASQVVLQRKWPLVLPGLAATDGATPGTPTLATPSANCSVDSATTVVCVLAIDLAPVEGVLGAWAGGGITHPNRLEGPPLAPTVSALYGGNRVGGALQGATEVPLSGAADAAAHLRGAYAVSPSSNAGSTFQYRATGGPSLLTLVLARAPPDATLGELTLQLNYAPALSNGAFPAVAQQFSVDLRRAGCLLADSPDFVGAGLLAKGVAYPDNSLCTFPPTILPSAEGGNVTRGAFTADAVSLATSEAAALALGASPAAVITMLESARVAARGGTLLSVAPGALGGNTPVTASVPRAALVATLPPPPKPVASSAATAVPPPTVDFAVALLLGPAGTRFTPPFTVCILVGNVPSSQHATLIMTTLRNPSLPAGGYGPWEIMSEGSFNPATGMVCGQGDHFSIVAPMYSVLPQPLSVPKGFETSAACPRGGLGGAAGGDGTGALCSGAGHCVDDGRCRCYPGFTGADCGQRTCPGAESWGQSLYYGVARAAPLVGAGVHLFEECAGRGSCNRGTGLCACFPGFEGAACQRWSCPKRTVETTEFLFLDETGTAAAAAEEAAWEAAFLQELPSDAALRETPVNGQSVSVQEECSGHGQCRTVAELLPAGAPLPWAAHRMQKCACDAGYVGGDCSQRTCPVGVDRERAHLAEVEYHGAPQPSVQRLTLSFPALPPSASGAVPLDPGSDELCLVASDPFTGARAATEPARGLWAGTPAAAEALRLALAALPRYNGGEGITVAPAPSATTDTAVAYDITFDPAALNSFGGDAPLLGCLGATTPGGLLGGCTSPGCTPRRRQPRALLLPEYVPASIALDPRAVLLQPGAAPDGTPDPLSGWAVTTSLLLTRPMPGRIAYQWVGTTVYGVAVPLPGAPAPAWETRATPLPPGALREALPGPYGLLLNILEQDDAQLMDDLASIGAGEPEGPWQLDYAWRLPVCAVTAMQPKLPAVPAAECSDKGICDRGTGKCACFPGWEGVSCDTGALTDSV